ncbi:hypothetical protein TNCV_4527601 [Trichonephila clavipes]|nr:hypothetical protein TNCV_4527601 [Trichonephila clavipes]
MSASLVPLKSRRVKELMHFKSVDPQCSPVGVVLEFGGEMPFRISSSSLYGPKLRVMGSGLGAAKYPSCSMLNQLKLKVLNTLALCDGFESEGHHCRQRLELTSVSSRLGIAALP